MQTSLLTNSVMSGHYSPRLSISIPNTARKDSFYNNNDLSIRIDEPRRSSGLLWVPGNSTRDHQSLHPSEDEEGRTSCSTRTKRCVRGIILSLIIAFSWVGTFHLLKLTFDWNQRTTGPFASMSSSFSSSQAHSASLSTMLSPVTPTTDRLNEPAHEDDYDGEFTTIKTTTTNSFNTSTESPRASRYTSEKDSTRTSVIFNAPFFCAWFCSLWNVLFLPIFSFLKIFPCCFKREKTSSPRNILVESLNHLMAQGMTPLQFLGKCTFFCMMWILTHYLVIFTIRRLDVTVVMSLFACSTVLVYLLSWVVLHHQFVGSRIVAVIICDTGIALLAYMDGTNSKSLGPVVLAAAAAIAFSIYKVFYQRMIGYGSYGEMCLFFTLIGLLNAFLLWPVVILLYFTGSEVFFWNHIPWIPLSAAAGLNFTGNLLGYIGGCWTYEVFLSLGILLAIPVSSVIDATIYRVVFKGMKLGGVLLIMLGFLVVLLPDNWNKYLTDIVRNKFSRWKGVRRSDISKGKNGTRVQDTTTAQLSRLRTPSGRVK